MCNILPRVPVAIKLVKKTIFPQICGEFLGAQFVERIFRSDCKNISEFFVKKMRTPQTQKIQNASKTFFFRFAINLKK
jgi:hypothetical protein